MTEVAESPLRSAVLAKRLSLGRRRVPLRTPPFVCRNEVFRQAKCSFRPLPEGLSQNQGWRDVRAPWLAEARGGLRRCSEGCQRAAAPDGLLFQIFVVNQTHRIVLDFHSPHDARWVAIDDAQGGHIAVYERVRSDDALGTDSHSSGYDCVWSHVCTVAYGYRGSCRCCRTGR